MIYFLDTNVISDIMQQHENVTTHFKYNDAMGNVLVLSAPIEYEIRRGLIHKKAIKQLEKLESGLFPLLQY